MNYTAHPSTLNDGEVSFKEKQYLLPKYQKIARDNIGALDTEKVLELIKEHGGGGGEAGEIEYYNAGKDNGTIFAMNNDARWLPLANQMPYH